MSEIPTDQAKQQRIEQLQRARRNVLQETVSPNPAIHGPAFVKLQEIDTELELLGAPAR